ncbi:hypothetical protein [Aliarcobacter butzleri]|uniref:hypothetical protein n=1 Tax=Aliarcobacter butzleri TaxID=28197 RepID=UPI003AF8747A
MLKNIRTEEIHYLYRRRVDPVGEVFFWENRVFRGINYGYEQEIEELMHSGLLKKLEEEKLIVNTQKTDFKNQKYSLILEHSLIYPEIYSEEMVFDMIKEVAITILKIAKISFEYGYQLKDCHLQNILFEGTIPKFVDIGSFKKINQINKDKFKWIAEDEFLRVYIYPLTLWTIGFEDYAKKLYITRNNVFTSTYFRLKYPLFNLIPIKYHYKLIKTINKYFHKYTNLDKLYNQISNLSLPKNKTKWGEYYDNIKLDNPRFNKVIETINTKCKNAKSCVDIAGNEGILADLILKSTHIKKAICLDYDEEAIKKGFNKNKKRENLFFANIDFMSSIGFINSTNSYSRYKSDITICLALTHHLLLGQKYDIKDICKNLFSITSKYLIIEFMPKGLWSEKSDKIDIPNWYTLEWFKNELSNFFEIQFIEEIADNRILIFGYKK